MVSIEFGVSNHQSWVFACATSLTSLQIFEVVVVLCQLDVSPNAILCSLVLLWAPYVWGILAMYRMKSWLFRVFLIWQTMMCFVSFMAAFAFGLLVVMDLLPKCCKQRTLLATGFFCLCCFFLELMLTLRLAHDIKGLLSKNAQTRNARLPNASRTRRRATQTSQVGAENADSPPIYAIVVSHDNSLPVYEELYPQNAAAQISKAGALPSAV